MAAIFQSTPPARGATVLSNVALSIPYISIHAPREGGDNTSWVGRGSDPEFQSTPPARGATADCPADHSASPISIHAPREGGDPKPSASASPVTVDFNPRPPRGGRLCVSGLCLRPDVFQSTPPARGATVTIAVPTAHRKISIHAPREGGDAEDRVAATAAELFQSTPPARGATLKYP